MLGSGCLEGLNGRPDDAQDHEPEQQRALVGDGVDDGVFVEFAARGEEPELGDPEQEDWQEEPEAAGVFVEVGVELRDVQEQDDDRGVAGSGTEGAKLLDVAEEVSAAVGGDLTALVKALELGEALDEGEG